MKKVYIQTDDKKRLIGAVGNGVFKTNRRVSLHLYRATNSWGIDAKALHGMIDNQGLHTIIIYDLDTKTTYTTTAKNYLEKGEYLHFKTHRAQIFLGLEHFNKS